MRRLPWPVLIPRENGMVAYADPTAEEALRVETVLMIRGGRLTSGEPRRAEALRTALEAICAHQDGAVTEEGGGVEVVMHDPAQEALFVTVAPMSRRMGHVLSGGGRVAAPVLASRPSTTIGAMAERLRRVSGLTPIEARLVTTLRRHSGLPYRGPGGGDGPGHGSIAFPE